MWTSKRFAFDSLGVEGSFFIPQIPSIDPSSVSLYDASECLLKSPHGEKRAHLSFTKEFDHGSYGTIREAIRDQIYVLVKQPRVVDSSLLQEALLQHVASKVLQSEGIPWAVPRVYDVFRNGSEIWFSMERIFGYSIPGWFADPSHRDLDALFLFAHVALILATLETTLNLDHRDLKMNNLMIKPEACTAKVKIHETTWTLNCPFQVVVLDFGFACLGSEPMRGKPVVNLGDGLLPRMDPCPKEGRDLFHFFTSLLSLPVFRSALSHHLHEKIDRWLSIGQKSYGPLARRWSQENWSYLVSSQKDFSIPSCCPLRILQDLLPELRGSLIKTSS